MSNLVRSPFWDNWFKKSEIEHSLIICSPYFKKNALDQIIELFKLDDEENILDIKILIRGNLDDFIKGSSDLSALDALLELRNIDIDNIRRVTNLHMKAYLKDSRDLLIGSGNCTASGLSFNNILGNVEAGIQTFDDNIIDDFNNYFYEIFDSAEPLEEFYDNIVEQYYHEVTLPINYRQPVYNNALGENEARFDFRNNNNVINNARIEITSQDIPQYSNFDQVINDTIQLAYEFTTNNETLTFDILGELLPGNRTNTVNAKKKYGENHAKTAELLEFVTIVPERPRKIVITRLGEIFLEASIEEKDRILARQLLRTAIVRDIFNKYSSYGKFDILEYLMQYLKYTTARRRKSNVKKFFVVLSDLGVHEADIILDEVF